MNTDNPFATNIEFHVTPDEWLDVTQLLAMFHESNSQVRTGLEIEAIQYSIRQDGFVSELIIVNRWNGKIVSGHGRVWACHQAGYRGKLPVLYKDYPGEPEHRLAMLKWNRARGHQSETLEQAEITALLAAYDQDALSTQLAYSDQAMSALLNDIPELTTRESKAKAERDDTSEDDWPLLKVQVSPDTMLIYRRLLDLAPGDNDGQKTSRIIHAVNPLAFPFQEDENSVVTDEVGQDG